jgi:hypothetical protein
VELLLSSQRVAADRRGLARVGREASKERERESVNACALVLVK